MQCSKRIPNGTIIGSIPLEAAKAFPTRYFTNMNLPIKIAYADAITNDEKNDLIIKYLPGGAKYTPHPQIVLYVRGAYHIETLSYNYSNPEAWTTWMEVHVDALQIPYINALLSKLQEQLQ